MTGRKGAALVAAAIATALGAAAPAQAAKRCDEPRSQWERATPAEAGMDAAALQAAVDHGTQNLSFAVRVYRHGCLVAEDRLASLNRNAQFESWSMAKSITALVFGRAMTLGLVSPDDPLGSLLTEADEAHGRITLRDLLTMTSGLKWNGLRDYDVAMPDRLTEALTVGIAHEPGTYYEYSQSGPALLANAVERALGEDFQAFAQRELFGPLGIPAGSWRWTRDSKGNEQGFFGMQMRPDDYARLGELLRRGGVWRGRRLLSQAFVRQALTPSRTNGCYGWMIWLNAAKPCIGPRIIDRPKDDARSFPTLPADLFRFSGLLGQLVSVFPSQGIVVQRSGVDTLVNFTGGSGWETGLYERVLAAVRDEEIEPPPDAADVDRVEERPDEDTGFLQAAFAPQEALGAILLPPLPPAGPERARALRVRLAHNAASRRGVVALRATCPARWPGRRSAARCEGEARIAGGARPVRYDLAAGETKVVRVRLSSSSLRSLRRAGRRTLAVTATNQDRAGGTPAQTDVTLRAPAQRRATRR